MAEEEAGGGAFNGPLGAMGESGGVALSTVWKSALLVGCIYISTGDCWMEVPAVELMEFLDVSSLGLIVGVLLSLVPLVKGRDGKVRSTKTVESPFGLGPSLASHPSSSSNPPPGFPLGSAVMLGGRESSQFAWDRLAPESSEVCVECVELSSSKLSFEG